MAGGLDITADVACELGTGCLLVMRISSLLTLVEPLQTAVRRLLGPRMIGNGSGHVKPDLISEPGKEKLINSAILRIHSVTSL
jgi:hypothetical protein